MRRLFILGALIPLSFTIYADLSKVISIINEQDNSYSVVCSNGTRELVDKLDVSTQNLCPHTPKVSPEELIIPITDMIFYSDDSSTREMYIGKEKRYKDSLVDFIYEVPDNRRICKTEIYDKNYNFFRVNKGEKKRFVGLTPPIKFSYGCLYGDDIEGSFKLTNVEYRIKGSKSIMIPGPKDSQQKQTIDNIGNSPNKIKMFVQIEFFKNYVTNECYNVDFISKSGSVSFNIKNLSSYVELDGPIEIQTSPLCYSARNRQPENPLSDFNIHLSNIETL